MYGAGFLGVGMAVLFQNRDLVSGFFRNLSVKEIISGIAMAMLLLAFLLLPAVAEVKPGVKPVQLAGVQMEFPGEHVLPKMLDQALAKNTNAEIFVLSEYTLEGGVPDALKNWC